MSYALLSSLYFGEGTNADLATPETRTLMHVPTDLDELLPSFLSRGLDVVLTGNPGDGKSHLVRLLQDKGALSGASVELDLSAKPTADVLAAWRAARSSRHPFVLCANEGPLTELLAEMSSDGQLSRLELELRGQLGRLVGAREDLLPPSPKHAVLVDLADRSVLDERLVELALSRVCDHRFLPRSGTRSTETSAGRNLLLFAESPATRRRLATVLVRAGIRYGHHVSFRQLWSAISYAITAGKKESTLAVELSVGKVGLGTYPLDNLVKANGRGLLIDATRRYGDPASVTDPWLDEQLWTTGKPSEGSWFFDEVPTEIPARIWSAGDHEGALAAHASLKRLVALAHEAGEPIIDRLRVASDLPEAHADSDLLRLAVEGIRRLYVSPSQEVGAADWLIDGLPLWIGLSYQDIPAERRPHVAVVAAPEHAFELLRPVRPPWLRGALGPLPAIAWLSHRDSGVSLRLDAGLISLLSLARRSSGPVPVPERVHRFLSRLAGWEEGRDTSMGGDHLAVLSHPRGELIVTARTQRLAAGGFAYA